MKSTGRIVWTPFVRAFFVAATVACLCFSAGEGLRLTPLPALSAEAVRAHFAWVNASPSVEAAQYLSGPLDLPARGQTRTKRKQHDCESLLACDWHEIPSFPLEDTGSDSPLPTAKRLLNARPPGRAPPFNI